ncbi:unnamed protein product, partial [Iphiclides podalirius]
MIYNGFERANIGIRSDASPFTKAAPSGRGAGGRRERGRGGARGGGEAAYLRRRPLRAPPPRRVATGAGATRPPSNYG